MKKIKTKGRKWTVKKVVTGPTYSVTLHKTHASHTKTVEALVKHFEITEDLAKVAIKTTPIVLISELSQHEATRQAKQLKSSGDFRVWLSTAAKHMRKMNFKVREEPISL